ncbi:MAG TPA: glycoside hydrolase family 97 N-terminal domain-containing protein, partial [Chitinophagaceae bacterium]|nr:glycoside hydrolase family 97 N-terminal domain-containing protein [Chitinophagaceae bacterium]
MTIYRTALFWCMLIGLGAKAQQGVFEKGAGPIVFSPDKNIGVSFYVKKADDGKKTMYYEVAYKNKQVIEASVLDIQLDNHLSESAMALKVDRHERWCENLEVKQVVSRLTDSTWKPVYGEYNTVRDYYNAVTIEMVKDDNPIYKMNLELRAYNEGVAIRYFFPENEKGTYYNVVAENTSFKLPAGTKAWFAGWAQGPYQLLPLSDWPGESERPLTLELPNGLYACLAEAGMTDYARTKFKLAAGAPNTIVTSMDGAAA